MNHNDARRRIPRAIELLAPARNAEIGIEALRHGADAIYIGAELFGARSAAGNSTADIRRLVDFAHSMRARVYVTLNTILFDSELSRAERLVRDLYSAGVDALIIQDMGLLRLNLPPIELHASTQCDIRTPERARFLADAGMSRLVIPRELTLDETRAIAEAVPSVELEAFVHGALCVSYSGDCHAGAALTHRSANRGECPQICRHLFTLCDAAGNRLMPPRHFLSLRDLNRADILPELLDSGVCSLKIEGRLKDVTYVKNIVGYYRRRLDHIIDAAPDRYRKASAGRVELNFTPDPDATFNRGYTAYFTTERHPAVKMGSLLTPKWAGRRIGSVERADGTHITCNLTESVGNADGLTYFTSSGTLEGFNVNTGAQAPHGVITSQRPMKIAPGTVLYRNFNKLATESLSRPDSAERTIDINLTLRRTPSGIALDASTPDSSLRASAAAITDISPARTPQADTRRDILSRTGATLYTVVSLSDTLSPDDFVPKSVLTALRRNLTDALDTTIAATHPYGYRRKEIPDALIPESSSLTYHHNVANKAAHIFYTGHGATDIQQAIEVTATPPDHIRVMTTRYCLRRELDACLRTPKASRLPSELYLHSGPIKLALKFDCKNCEMHVIK